MSVFKRWNGTSWETIGPQISSARFDDTNHMIAPEYSSTSTYNVGDYVVQSDRLYKCISAIESAEEWTAAHWSQVSMGGEISNLNSAIQANQIVDNWAGNGVMQTSGTLVADNSYRYSNPVFLSKGDTISVYSYLAGVNTCRLYGCDSSGAFVNVISNVNVPNSYDTAEYTCNNPDGEYVAYCARVGNNETVIVYTFTLFAAKESLNKTDSSFDRLAKSERLNWFLNYVIQASGKVEANSGRAISNYIPCYDNVQISFVSETASANVSAITFYDRSKNRISSLSNIGTDGDTFTATTPEGTRFIRLSTLISMLDSSFVSFGTSVVDSMIEETSELTNNIKKINEKNKIVSANEYVFPTGLSFASPVKVFTDGNKYTTDFKRERFMQTGGNTYYVAPISPYPGAGHGLSYDDPTQFYAAYNLCTDGDTIIMKKGFYHRNNVGGDDIKIRKSINIIAEEGTFMLSGDVSTFVKTNGFTNVYEVTRSGGRTVYDFATLDGEIIKYILVNSKEEVDATEGTFFIDSSNIFYVHCYGGENPTGKVFINLDNPVWMWIDNNNGAVSAYIENVNVVGMPYGIRLEKFNEQNNLQAVYNNCKFIFGGEHDANGVTVYGADLAIFKNCIVVDSTKDGFNYNGVNRNGDIVTCRCVEIDCSGHGNGNTQSGDNMNGSTAHAGAKVIRINGNYYDNHGPNVSDVQDGTMSVNLGCKATKTNVSSGQNFSVVQGNAIMWLENCIGVGSVADFYCGATNEMYLNKCSYITKSGEITETENIPVDSALLILAMNQ